MGEIEMMKSRPYFIKFDALLHFDRRSKSRIKKFFLQKIQKVLAQFLILLYSSTRDAGVVQRLERVLAKD